MKSKNIKLKHRKYSLYSKKKSKGRQALAVILTIVIVVALGVVGFGLGRPIMDYLNGGDSQTEETSGWTPPVDTSETVADTAEVTSETETVEAPEIPTAEVIYTIPAGALRSAETLKSVAAAAKAEGFTTAVVTMKNSSGNFLYKTEHTGLQYGGIIAGTLSAQEISDIITAEGLVPCARISTLMDKMSGDYLAGLKYYTADGMGWLDARAEEGGKAWVNPFGSKTEEYCAFITTELVTAGFKKIILADTLFPQFRQMDLEVFLSNQPQLGDPAQRLDALWRVVTACETAAESGGATIMLELNAEDMDAADKTSTTAEIAADKARLTSVELLIDYTPVSGSEYAGVKSFTGKLASQYSGQKYSVLVAENSVSEDGWQQLLQAFGEAGIVVYSE